MRIFLDANILFSAAKSEGAIRQMLVLLAEAGHVCCVDQYVVEEARRNLELKASAGLAAFDALLESVEVVSSAAQPDALELPTTLPAKDRPVLATAILAKCDALVTGDRTHFGLLYGKVIGGVTVHSPQSLAKAVL